MLISQKSITACLFSIGLGALASQVCAQSQTLPRGFDAVDGNGATSFPQNNVNDHVWQWHYDSLQFDAAFPIIITEVSVRASTATATVNAFDFPDWEVVLIEASTDYQVGAHDPIFANNVLNQTVVRPAGTPWAIGAPIGPSGAAAATWIPMGLSTVMQYDPTSGNDFIVQIRKCGTNVTWGASMDGASAGAGLNGGNRYGFTTSCTATTSTFQNNEFVPIVKIDYVPAAGLFASFTADVQEGPSPLTVNFTDTTFTSDPGGVLSWAWDFDNDGTVDSTVQNPTHIYTSCGDFDVSLTVTDVTGTDTKLETGFITTDLVTASFTASFLAPPGIYQFTDTSTPTPTSWAWDFDNDGTVDSTAQNPVYPSPTACLGTDVSLTVTHLCRTDATVVPTFLAPNTLTGTLAGGNGTSSTTQVGNLFDISVTSAEGINLCGLTVTPYSQIGQMDMEVYLTDGSHVGKDTDPTLWRLIGTGSFISAGGAFAGPTPHSFALDAPAYIPAGDYGVAIYMSNPAGTANVAYTNGPQGPFSDANLTIIVGGAGVAKTGFFAGSTFSPRIWNGEMHYTLCSGSFEPGYGYYGPGCAGTAGIPSLTATSPPRINTTMQVDIGNVGPAGLAIMSIGFSNTVSASFGSLPFDGTPFGAPGCFLRMSTDSNSFLFGTPTATWSLALPNSTALLCTQFFNQAFCVDSVNALGFVASDAHAGIIGQ